MDATPLPRHPPTARVRRLMPYVRLPLWLPLAAAVAAEGGRRLLAPAADPGPLMLGAVLAAALVGAVVDRRDRGRWSRDAARELRRREAILAAVARVGEHFLRAPDPVSGAPDTLRLLGEAAGVSRVYLFRFHGEPGATRCSQLAEWCAPGVVPQIDNAEMQDWPLRATGHGRWDDALLAGEAVHGPAERFPEGERAVLRRQQIRSLALVPVRVAGSWWGFIGFDDCHAAREWTHELDALRAAAGTLGAAMERERTAAALRESEERFRILSEVTTEGIVLHEDGRVVDANPGLARMLGRTVAELVGTDAYALAAEPFRESMRARVRGGDGEPYEVEALHADGHTFPVEIAPREVRLDGRALRVVAVRDLGERRRAEAARLEVAREQAARRAAEAAERRAAFLAEASRVLGSSFDYETTLASLARLSVPALADYCTVDLFEDGQTLQRVGLAHVDPAGEALLEELARIPVRDRRYAFPVTTALNAGRGILFADINAATLDEAVPSPPHRALVDRLAPRSGILVPVRAAGRPLGVLTLVRSTSGRRFDADDLALAEELSRRAGLAIDNARLFLEAEQATRARDHMLAVVAHDLRDPLSAVTLGADVLEAALPDGGTERQRRHLAIVRRSAERMDRLIGDLLDVVRIEEGRLAVVPVPQDPGAVLAEACEALRPLAAQRGTDLVLTADAGLPEVGLDAARVQQLLSNLVGNALKFTPRGGRVALSAAAAAGEVRFAVADTGPGISPDQIPHLFSRFWQADRGDRRGVGLGLSIARGIVEAHGGRIWVESRVGEGSTFFFTFPVPGGDG